jgi:general secretion pathway protein L
MTTALIARRTIAAGQLLRRGIAWWLAELAQVTPAPLLRLLGKADAPTAMLEVGADRVILMLSDRSRPSPVTIPLTGYGEDEVRARVKSAIRNRRTGTAVVVRLAPGLVFETSLELPISATPALRSILEHQIERLVPLSAAEACFEYRVAPHAPLDKTVKVHLSIAKRETIDRALASARDAGLSPRLVIAPPAEGPADEGRGRRPLVLWRAGRAATESAAQRRLLRGLEIGAVLLLLCAYGCYVHRLDLIRDDLAARVAEAKRAASQVQALGQRIEQQGSALALLRHRRADVPPLKLLDAITRLVPDDSWVTQLSLRDRTLEMIGYAPRVTDLIARIEGSAMLEKPQFRAPITLSPDGKGERFTLSVEIKPEPQPGSAP